MNVLDFQRNEAINLHNKECHRSQASGKHGQSPSDCRLQYYDPRLGRVRERLSDAELKAGVEQFQNYLDHTKGIRESMFGPVLAPVMDWVQYQLTRKDPK